MTIKWGVHGNMSKGFPNRFYVTDFGRVLNYNDVQKSDLGFMWCKATQSGQVITSTIFISGKSSKNSGYVSTYPIRSQITHFVFVHVGHDQIRLYLIARNAQVCCRLVTLLAIKPISECVRIACSGLMITSLLQVVNWFTAS